MDLTHELISVARQYKIKNGVDLFHLNSLMGASRYVSDARLIQELIGRDRPILDLGCGWGQMAFLLKRLGLRVTSSDIKRDTPYFVSHYNQAHPEDRIEYYYADILEIITGNTLAGRTFDAICLSGVLEHVPDFSLFLRRLRSLLTKQGKIFIFRFPNRYSWIEALNKLRFGNVMDHPIRFSRRELNFMLRWHGYTIDGSSFEEIFPVNLRGFPQSFITLYHNLNRLLMPISAIACAIPVINMVSTSFRVIGTKSQVP